MEQIGALAALGAALVWTLNSTVIEKKGRGLDSGSLNFGRMILGLILITFVCVLSSGQLLPQNTGVFAWLSLLMSGFVGFSLGDTFLMKSFQTLGARLTLLIFSFAPVLTAVLSYFFFGESLSIFNVFGMALVLFGIVLVISGKQVNRGVSVSLQGLLFALAASLGQALGAVLSKFGLENVSPLPATQIRLLGGLAGMAVMMVLSSKRTALKQAFRSANGRQVILSGAVLGTLIGVTLSMTALKLSKGAIASTLMSTMPVLILPISVLILKEKLSLRDIAGAVISVAGMAVLFL